MPNENPRPVALVTGAARRVGRAIAIRLASDGFDVAFTYLNSEADAHRLSRDIEAKGRRSLAIRADLTAPTTNCTAVFQQFSAAFDRLDVLVNNASIYTPAGLAEVDTDLMRRLWAIHVESPMLLCKAFAGALRKTRGAVVNMLDLLAEKPLPAYLAYSASKAALWNLTLGLARELAPEVTVNGIAPGVVEWPADYPEDKRAQYLKRVPLGRAGTPEDVAAAVAYLVSGNGYMTGQIMRLDGGRSIT